ncbi:Probable ubiquitin carboxyl-terminal hydrolase creB [Seminavis robusta]|uniref:ubiquitinyl hydrolase 1 n=1 Tax=Seminavis robusta TaxID=568900 RepID=A0A9N8EJX1_9STRA|nr:Probable ubiquitin carboxyl-terminal hydrolase creB [Seminavis robusta]|eukprot:Sro1304_g261100.1 Probable ubiquitin carboxyl-terminal hydrolase creB (1967) ;mRNA; r:20821-26859
MAGGGKRSPRRNRRDGPKRELFAGVADAVGDTSPILDPNRDNDEAVDCTSPSPPPKRKKNRKDDLDDYQDDLNYNFASDGQEMFASVDDDNHVVEHASGAMTGGYEPPVVSTFKLTRYRATKSSGSSKSDNSNNTTRSTRSGVAGSTTKKDETKSSNGKKNQRSRSVLEEKLDELIEQAEYELTIDPYRGMIFDATNDDDAKVKNPWKACLEKEQANSKRFQDRMEHILNRNKGEPADQADAWVEETLRCNCPSALAWTEEGIKKDRQAAKRKTSKKRKANSDEEQLQPPPLAQRPMGVTVPCDYNPYCTCSMGGVFNTIWQEKAEQILQEKLQQRKNAEELWQAQKDQENKDKNAPKPRILGMPQPAKKPRPPTATRPANGEVVEVQDSDDDSMDVESAAVDAKKVANDDAKPAAIDDDPAVDVDTNVEYGPEATKLLQALRPSITVQTETIQEYLVFLLSSLPHTDQKTHELSVDGLLKIYNDWQQSLIFQNPVDQEEPRMKDDDDTTSLGGTIKIAQPVGLSNLGATCYLNSQLQCLAQNQAFLAGLFSWRSQEDKGDNHAGVMNAVLTNLQSLLAQMVEGSKKTVTTIDFSTALGLEHDEQQDPNEFARLLFERMHESFQQQPSLATLLPSLFEGVTTYETTCLTCKRVSIRKEKFMDLTLAIVDYEKKPKGLIGRTTKTIMDFFGYSNCSADTDLEYCLKNYLSTEEFTGDNQYFCGTCGCKRDATRETKLGELPPVLNFQLSRYVFDMKTLTKKKLTKEVLLPRKLRVPVKVSDAVGERIDNKEYVLCAVMKHHGNSAYRGHYVAEVQDFLSGQWYEFNDEEVKLLEKGPTCSYDPSDLPEDTDDDDGPSKRPKGPKLTGSSDAYNMYYVEASYLAKTAVQRFQELESQQHRLIQITKEEMTPAPGDFIQSVAAGRNDHYGELFDMCMKEQKAFRRLQKRKNNLKKELFLLPAKPSEKAPPVWVSAELFQRFVSGTDRLEDIFGMPAGESLLRHKHLLCNHDNPGLDPRIARKGKLLPRYMYDSYIRLLEKEHRHYLIDVRDEEYDAESPKATNLVEVNDCVITPTTNMQCEECSKSYQERLREQLDRVQILKRVYEQIKDTDEDVAIRDIWEDDDSSDDEESSEFAFVVMKTNMTKLRKSIESGLFKALANQTATTSKSPRSNTLTIDVDSDKRSDEASNHASTASSLSEGLYALDLSVFSPDSLTITSGLDSRINEEITCSHGNTMLAAAGSKGKVRWVRPALWDDILKILPDAIEHKIILNGKDAGEDARKGCSLCKREKRDKDKFDQGLRQWFDDGKRRGDAELGDLFRDARTDATLNKFGGLITNEITLADIQGEEYVPVSVQDISLWRQLMQQVERGRQKKLDAKKIQSKLEELLVERVPHWPRFQTAPLEGGFLSRLKCIRHSSTLPIFEAVSSEPGGSPLDQVEDTDDTWQLKGIKLMEKTQYENFKESIANLCKVLASTTDNGEAPTHKAGTIDLCDDDDDQPPTVRVVAADDKPSKDKDGQDEGTVIKISVASALVSLLVSPRLCLEEGCCQEFQPVDFPATPQKTPEPDTIVISEDEKDEKGSSTFSCQVFEVKADHAIDDAVSDLLEAQVWPGMDNAPVEDSFAPRRSTRNRRSKFPFKSILQKDVIDVGWHHNLAAVRTFLMQVIDNFPLDQKLVLVVAQERFENNGERQRPRPLPELLFDKNDQVLQDVYEKWAEGASADKIVEPNKCLVLLRQDDPSSSIPQATLMDACLEMSNAMSEEKEEENGGKKGKGKAAERGFRGTLLSSFRSSATTVTTTTEESTACTGTLTTATTTVDKDGVADEGETGADEEEARKGDVPVVEEPVVEKVPADIKESNKISDDDSSSEKKLETEPKKPRTAGKGRNDTEDKERSPRRSRNAKSGRSVLETVGGKEEKVNKVADRLKEIAPSAARAFAAAEAAFNQHPDATVDFAVNVASNLVWTLDD